MNDFDMCVDIARSNGRFNIYCKLGLWSVSSESLDVAQREALNYFRQYKADGEYYRILGGKSPAELLKG